MRFKSIETGLENMIDPHLGDTEERGRHYAFLIHKVRIIKGICVPNRRLRNRIE